MKDILILYSGGLDSRLSIKLLNKQGYRPTAVFFRLPFSKEKPVYDEFLKEEEVSMITFDCTRGRLLRKYLEVLKNPRFPRGAGFNPCLDCKLFMFGELEDYALSNGIEAVASGEVPGQRPLSQTSGKMDIIEEETKVEIIRPLAEKGINGRSRKKQMAMAEAYNISYPSPAGGCLLCEKELAKRFETLITKDLITENTLPLINVGRHFYYEEEKVWFVVGRDKEENDVMETFKHVIPSGKGKPAVFYHPGSHIEYARQEALKLQRAYQQKDAEAINHYTNWKL
jgi:PP-loop superfamily ATP-utilizing enzyme